MSSRCGGRRDLRHVRRQPRAAHHREVVEQRDAEAALAQTIANTIRFWSSEDAILAQIYGVVAIDLAARNLVDRQRADRRGEMRRLIQNLHAAGRLQAGLSIRNALALIVVLSRYESFRELRQAGLSEREITTRLQGSARALLVASR